MLQRKAGYIDARPLTAELVELSCNARPDHTFGSGAPVSPICPEYDRNANILPNPRSAKDLPYIIPERLPPTKPLSTFTIAGVQGLNGR